MLKDKVTVNVGEDNAIYVEMHSLDTPVSELKYGDTKYDENGNMEVWYGEDEGEMSGWVASPWNSSNYSAGLIQVIKNSNTTGEDLIYRILNNDITFNEEEYLAATGVTIDE